MTTNNGRGSTSEKALSKKGQNYQNLGNSIRPRIQKGKNSQNRKARPNRQTQRCWREQQKIKNANKKANQQTNTINQSKATTQETRKKCKNNQKSLYMTQTTIRYDKKQGKTGKIITWAAKSRTKTCTQRSKSFTKQDNQRLAERSSNNKTEAKK